MARSRKLIQQVLILCRQLKDSHTCGTQVSGTSLPVYEFSVYSPTTSECSVSRFGTRSHEIEYSRWTICFLALTNVVSHSPKENAS